MTNKISRLIKRMTEEPFPTDGSLYDLGDGKVYQTEDGYTFHAVGDVSLLQNGCSNGACSTTLEVPTTTMTNTKEIKTVSASNDIFADIVGYSIIKREFVKALESTSPVGILLDPEHGKSVVGIVHANHTFGILSNEVSENNKRVATDIVRAANALQSAVKSNPSPTQADVKAKIDNLNATLQEAIAVRVPKVDVSNSTINGEAAKDLMNETLRQYGYAFGISSVNRGNTSNINSSASATPGAAPNRNTFLNMSAFQSAQALASQAQGMLTETKSLLPTNATSATTSTIAKVANHLSQLKNAIDTKSPYGNVASLVQKTIYPDLDGAFRLK